MYVHLLAQESGGISYHKPAPLRGPPAVPFKFLPDNNNLLRFLELTGNQMIGILNVAHATYLKKHKSAMGTVICLKAPSMHKRDGSLSWW